MKTIELTKLDELLKDKRNEYLSMQQKCNMEYSIANVISSNNTKNSSIAKVPHIELIKEKVISHSTKEDYIIKKDKLTDHHLKDKSVSTITVKKQARSLNVDLFNEFPWATYQPSVTGG